VKKLSIKRESVMPLTVDNLSNVVGGARETSGGISCLGGCNTRLICVDTNAVTNCNCTGQTFQCPSVSCPQYPF
jgi:hypothetical protein